MLMLPPFLMIEGLVFKAFLAAFFALLALLAGKRLRWGYFLVLVFSVCFFHLLSPRGKVLLEFGKMAITSGALESGLIRGLTLAGMIFLSLASVSSDLRFPGLFGGLLGRTFFYFDSIIEGKKRLSRKNFFLSLDELLIERFNPDHEIFGAWKSEIDEAPSSKTERFYGGWIATTVVVLIPWCLWLYEKT